MFRFSFKFFEMRERLEVAGLMSALRKHSCSVRDWLHCSGSWYFPFCLTLLNLSFLWLQTYTGWPWRKFSTPSLSSYNRPSMVSFRELADLVWSRGLCDQVSDLRQEQLWSLCRISKACVCVVGPSYGWILFFDQCHEHIGRTRHVWGTVTAHIDIFSYERPFSWQN